MYVRSLRWTALAALVLCGPLAWAAKPAVPAATSRLDAPSLARVIDQQIQQRLQEEKVKPSPLADDAEFLRRVCLDLTGKVPTAERAAAFLSDTDPHKRARLIDELLASSDYGRHQADLWQALLLPRNSDVRFVKREPMVQWLEENFNQNKPWNKMVHDLMTASGEQDKNGAVTYFLTNNTVDKINDSVSRLFLGVQLQCAQCHNHPFTEWKQTDYWHQAAFFMKTQIDPARNPNKGGGTPGVQEGNGKRRGKNFLPESAKELPPKFLQAEQPTVQANQPLRPVLADWITSANNPYFSKAMVNRTWYQLFGRGLVNPIDDMHESNAASHPELLNELANQFALSGFDLKYLIRAICNSQAYQRTSKPLGSNADADPAVYSRMPVKVLSPEQLYDSLSTILGVQGEGGAGRKANPARNGPVTPRQAFVAFFMLEDPDPTEYQVGIPQVLRLMNSQMTNSNSALGKVLKDAKDPALVVDQLYLTVLSRKPSAGEKEMMLAHVKKQSDAKTGYADILWAMLNSSEFALNR
jgi:hypothetical protein